MRGAIARVCSCAFFLVVVACDGGSPTFTDAGVIGGDIDAPVGHPMLAIDRDRADLGMIMVGESSAPTTFRITNQGDAATGGPMVVVTGAGFRAMTDTCTGTPLAAGAMCQVAVIATPTAAGMVGGMLQVSASPGGQVSATLSVTGLSQGLLRVLPPSVDFGMVIGGTMSAPQDLTVENTGDLTTGPLFVALAGADALEFEIASNGCAGMALAGHTTCTVTMRMRPSLMASGAKAAMVTVMSNPGGTVVAQLMGTAQRPALLAITGSGAFGGVLVGSTAMRTLTVVNNGALATGAVTITRTGSSSFQVLGGMAGDCVSGTTTLMPGAMCAVRVQYNVTLPGGVVGTIMAAANPGGAATSSLTGTGQRPARLTADLVTTFAPTEVGVLSTSAVQWTITNAGDQPSSVPMTVATAEIVIVSNTCTAALPAAGTCVVTLRFRPSTGGARSGTVTVAVTSSTVMATASTIGLWRVSLSRTGDSGTVTSNPAGLTCAAPAFACTGLFAPGAITLQARTTNGSLVYFREWSGASAGACANGPNRDCQLTVDGPEAITAAFDQLNFNLAFVSSTESPTNLGGVAPYDAACNAAATMAGINDAGGNAFIAWVSDGTSSALSRIGLASGWVRMDGRAVAQSRNTLFAAQGVLNPVRYTETGEDLGETTLLTGTREDGSAAAAGTCSNWTSTGGANLMTGNGMGGPTVWSAAGPTACSAATYHLLCVMKSYVGGPVSTTFMGKKLWLSNSAYAPAPTANPDTLCNNERPAGVALGRALVSRTNAAASTLLTAATMYVRPDGQEIGTGAEIVAGTARGGIWQSANLAYWSGQAWTGSATIDTAGITSSTCDNWVEGASTGRFAIPGFARRVWGSNLPVIVCNNIPATGPRLHCYEP